MDINANALFFDEVLTFDKTIIHKPEIRGLLVQPREKDACTAKPSLNQYFDSDKKKINKKNPKVIYS